MKRAVGLLCACLLLAGAGCAWQFGNTRVEADVKIDDRALDLALDQAAARVQQELQRLGLEVTVNPAGDAVRVVSKMKSGEQFTIVLTRARTATGKEQTNVRVEWGSRPDRELWFKLLVALGPVVVQAGR